MEVIGLPEDTHHHRRGEDMMTIKILSAIALLVPAVLVLYFAITNFTYDEKNKKLQDGEGRPIIIGAAVVGALVAAALLAALWNLEYINIIEPGIRFDTAGWKWFLTIYFAIAYGAILYSVATMFHKWFAFILNWHIKHGHGHKK